MPLWLIALVFAAADEPARLPTRVHFQAPAECPPAAQFERELLFRTRRLRLVAEGEEPTAWIEVSITAKARRFSGTLEVRTADGLSTQKMLNGPRCESVAAALSLAAALVLDPEANLGAMPAPPAVEAAVTPPATSPAPPATPPAPLATPPAPPAPAVRAPAPEVVPSAISFALAGLGYVTTGISGLTDFGGGLTIEVGLALADSRVHPTARLSAGVGNGRTITGAGGAAQYPLHALGQLDLGVGLQLGVFRPEVFGIFQLVPVLMQGVGAEEVISSQRWLVAVGPAAGLSLDLGAWRAGLGVGLSFSLLRERYRIEPDGPVFAVPPLSLFAALHAGHTIP